MGNFVSVPRIFLVGHTSCVQVILSNCLWYFMYTGTSDSEANGESRDVEDMGVVVEDLQHSNKDTDCCEVSVCHEGSAEPSTDSSVNQSCKLYRLFSYQFFYAKCLLNVW